MKKVVKKVSAKPKPASVKKSAKKSSPASSPPKKKVAKKSPPTKTTKKVAKRAVPQSLKVTPRQLASAATQPAKSSREPVYYLERAGRVMTFSEGDKWLKENPAPLDSKPSFGSAVSISERAMSTDSYDKRYGSK